MDKDTFANHISKLSKREFDIACNFVLKEVFSLRAINVDGQNDGGTDFTAFDDDGSRRTVAYQITTQKTDIKRKAYNDAKKAIDRLGITRFCFMTTYMLSESEAKSLETTIDLDLQIATTVYTPSIIAGLIIDNHLENAFLDKIDYPELRSYTSTVDYREMALHGYTILSQDAKNLKSRVYDDSLIVILYGASDGLGKEVLVDKVIESLSINPSKRDLLLHRIDALLSSGQITKIDDVYTLTERTKADVIARQRLYERELDSLVAAQTDLFNEYEINWTLEDSRLAATWIANAHIEKQLSNLSNAGVGLISHILKRAEHDGVKQLEKYIKENKLVSDTVLLRSIVEKLLEMASSHPLITKLTRASVYLALEGTKPTVAVKALGAQRWCDINMLVEPTIAIPYVCSQMFKGSHVNKYFDNGIVSIDRAKQLNMSIHIPPYYTKECAGHLLMARKFDKIDLNPEEMQYSSNAFVANYYACKSQGITLPETFMDYLALFSPAIRVERTDFKSWIREIMTSMQSILTRAGFNYLDMPTFKEEDRKQIETEYSYYLSENHIRKQYHLVQNDISALLYTNDRVNKYGEHWMIITYDKSLINVAHNCNHNTWINNPFHFLDMVEISNELPANKFHNLVHTMASYSDKTLAIGARMFDRIIQYATNDQMQDWQFRQDIDRFKKELVQRVSTENNDYMIEVDKRTDDFLKERGISINAIETEVDISVQ